VLRGQIRFERSVEAETLMAQLGEIPGISRAVAQYVTMRALGEPDSFPSEYLHLHRALNPLHSGELEHLAEDWRPWRAYAAMYVWWILAGTKARSYSSVPCPSISVSSAVDTLQ
jgi:AraC family transcriptional regulator, regulatory protein of adaptative response / DNA-3-methyladenine glycosylase II